MTAILMAIPARTVMAPEPTVLDAMHVAADIPAGGIAGGVPGGPVVAVACGVGFAVGLLLIASWVLGPQADDTDDADDADHRDHRAVRSWPGAGNGVEDGRSGAGLRLAGALGAAVVVGAFTRWPVAALLAGVGVWALPQLLAGDPGTKARVTRVEAIASWTEMLRDTLAAAAGLEQAIAATAATAPAAIRPQVQALQQRIESGERLTVALRAFADDLDDPAGDLVVAALVLASQHRARQLGDLLASLATASREQVTMRLRVASGRARTRTSVRLIIGVTLTMAGGMVLLNRSYLQPYNTLPGQLALTGIGLLFATALAWLGRIATIAEPARVLTGLNTLTARSPAVTPDGSAGGSGGGSGGGSAADSRVVVGNERPGGDRGEVPTRAVAPPYGPGPPQGWAR